MENKKILVDLFQAYYDARKNKRNTQNQLNFEINLEANIIELRQELISWKYEVWISVYFIQNNPVKREVFAGNFRDRVIHHIIFNYISPIFEKDFIYDSYSCRVWKWTLFWIKRVEKFIRSCSENYSEDCYILKLDISGYFMSINKDILYKKIENTLIARDKKSFISTEFLLNLIKKVIYNNPTKNAIFKGNKDDYIWLPKNKSLFFASDGCWLPIWNLTSQLFSNIYLSDFDKFVKHKLSQDSKESGLFYGRYVDDFVLMHQDKNYLKYCQKEIDIFLKNELKLTLHPNKIYLQHYSKWVLFLGSFIKPYRTYLKNKTKWNIFQKIEILNKQIRENKGKRTNILKQNFRQTINSYIWLIKWNSSYKLRKKILLKQVSAYFWNYFYISSWYMKVVKKK